MYLQVAYYRNQTFYLALLFDHFAETGTCGILSYQAVSTVCKAYLYSFVVYVLLTNQTLYFIKHIPCIPCVFLVMVSTKSNGHSMHFSTYWPHNGHMKLYVTNVLLIAEV
eukprot:569606_1